MHSTAAVTDEPTELIGRITSSRSGIRLIVTAENGEPGEDAWSVPAVVAGGALTVTFEDGNIEAMTFRRR